MTKILPLSMPPSTSYQSTAFSMGIILAHPNLQNLYQNHYVSFGCTDTDEISQLGLDFNNVGIGDYTKQGLGEMNLYHLANIPKSYTERFIRERIDQENYILLFGINEFYLSYTSRYQKENFIHDSYLYGYDEDSFWVMAYSDGKLKMMKIPSQEILDGLYSCLQTDLNSYFCTYRPSKRVEVQIDYAKIIKDIIDYGEGNIDLNDHRAYGIKIYQPLRNCIRKIEQNAQLYHLDMRPFRVLLEHKQSLHTHLDVLRGKVSFSDQIIKKIVVCEQLSKRIFMLAIKYNMLKDREILQRMIENIKILSTIENEALEMFKNTMSVYSTSPEFSCK